jgi:polysaccharide biosynthesis transport protein
MGPVGLDASASEDHRQVLRRQRVWIVVTTVVVAMVAGGIALAQTPLYEGEAQIIFDCVHGTDDVSLWGRSVTEGAAEDTERRVITSRLVLDRVAELLAVTDLNVLRRQVRTEAARDACVVRIVATDPDPVRATEIANALATAHLDLRRSQSLDAVLDWRAGLERHADAIRAELEQLHAARQPDPSVPEGLDADDSDATPMELPYVGPGMPVEGPEDRIRRVVLLAQLAHVSAQLADLEGLPHANTGGHAVLSLAEVATAPVSPRPLRTGVVAVALGLMLGVRIAFLRDRREDLIRDDAEFRRSTGGRPVLGRIPVWDDAEPADRLVAPVEPSSMSEESCRDLLAGVVSLLGDARGGDPLPDPGEPSRGHSLMVTSAVGGEGRTSTSWTLAVAAARAGIRTVLVEGDMRRPVLAKCCGFCRVTGLSDLLAGGDAPDGRLLDFGVEDLMVLTSGTVPPDPREVLAAPEMQILHEQLVALGDLVIYDSPPALAVPDALEIGRRVDLAILVGRAGVSGRRQVSAAIERLTQAGTDIAGTVWNAVPLMRDHARTRHAERPTQEANHQARTSDQE